VDHLTSMTDPVRYHLDVDDAILNDRWEMLTAFLQKRFGRESGIEAILFLIGIQSRGRGFEPKLQKELKQDIIMEGTYCAFEKLGLYERVGMDENGMWLWERSVPPSAQLSIEDQEKLLRVAILAYFEDVIEPAGTV
jgi:hypothetical protein